MRGKVKIDDQIRTSFSNRLILEKIIDCHKHLKG